MSRRVIVKVTNCQKNELSLSSVRKNMVEEVEGRVTARTMNQMQIVL